MISARRRRYEGVRWAGPTCVADASPNDLPPRVAGAARVKNLQNSALPGATCPWRCAYLQIFRGRARCRRHARPHAMLARPPCSPARRGRLHAVDDRRRPASRPQPRPLPRPQKFCKIVHCQGQLALGGALIYRFSGGGRDVDAMLARTPARPAAVDPQRRQSASAASTTVHDHPPQNLSKIAHLQGQLALGGALIYRFSVEVDAGGRRGRSTQADAPLNAPTR